MIRVLTGLRHDPRDILTARTGQDPSHAAAEAGTRVSTAARAAASEAAPRPGLATRWPHRPHPPRPRRPLQPCSPGGSPSHYLLVVSVSIIKASMLDHHLKKLKSSMSALSIRSHVPPLYLNLIKMYCVHSLQRITSHDMRDSMVQVSQLCHSFPATVVNMETSTLNLSCQVSPWTTPREAEKHD